MIIELGTHYKDGLWGVLNKFANEKEYDDCYKGKESGFILYEVDDSKWEETLPCQCYYDINNDRIVYPSEDFNIYKNECQIITVSRATTSVNNSTFANAIANANVGDTIKLTSNVTLTATVRILKENLTIDLNGYTIQGNGTFTLFYLPNRSLTIDDTKGSAPGIITKGYSSLGYNNIGDNLYSSPANTARCGGAFYVSGKGAYLHLKKCSIRSNVAEGDWGQGAGVYLFNEAVLRTESSAEFFNNTAKSKLGDAGNGWGACIYANGGSCRILINGGSFNNNSALTRGGVICLEGNHQVTISSGTFSSNVSHIGGVISIVNGENDICIVNGTFNNNRAGFGGGAIAIEGNTHLTIRNCTMTGNSVNAGNGGAVYFNSTGDLAIKQGTFNNNKVSGAGGAFYIRKYNSCCIGSRGLTVNIRNNEADITNINTSGGAFWLWCEKNMYIMNCNISGNKAGSCGAVYLRYNEGAGENVTCMFKNCTFENNVSVDRVPIIYKRDKGILQLDNCVFNGCSVNNIDQAPAQGVHWGAITINSGKLIASKINFKGNMSLASGLNNDNRNLIHLLGGSKSEINDLEIDGSQLSNIGRHIISVTENSELIIRNSTIKQFLISNSSTFLGFIFTTNSNNKIVINDTFVKPSDNNKDNLFFICSQGCYYIDIENSSFSKINLIKGLKNENISSMYEFKNTSCKDIVIDSGFVTIDNVISNNIILNDVVSLIIGIIINGEPR